MPPSTPGAPSGSLAVPAPAPVGDPRQPATITPTPTSPTTCPSAAFPPPSAPRPRAAARPSAVRVRVPGERLFRDGDRVAHARFGDGVVVTSKLTRDDEEVTVAFRAAA